MDYSLQASKFASYENSKNHKLSKSRPNQTICLPQISDIHLLLKTISLPNDSTIKMRIEFCDPILKIFLVLCGLKPNLMIFLKIKERKTLFYVSFSMEYIILERELLFEILYVMTRYRDSKSCAGEIEI